MPKNKITTPAYKASTSHSTTPLNQPSIPARGQQAAPINLMTPQNKTISLTSHKLESWFAAIERKNPQTPIDPTDLTNNPFLANIFICRFGFKNPSQILMYINSPAGAHLRSIIVEELLEMAEIEDYERAVSEENEWRRHLKLALLFLGLLYKEKAYANYFETVKQIIIDQQKQAQTVHEKAKKQAENEASIHQQNIINEQLQALHGAYNALDEKLKQKMQESERLEETLTKLEQEKISIEKEFIIFTTAIDEMNQLVGKTKESANPIQDLEALVATIQQAMEKQLLTIDEKLATGRKEEEENAIELIKKHQAYHIQIAGLNDMLDVLKGKKYYVDIDGNAVDTIHQALLVLNKSSKIVKDQDGKCYVISADENLEAIKQSANALERLNLAHRHYQRALAENSTVHTMVALNKSRKEEHHAKRYTPELLTKSAQLQTEIVVLSTQMLRIQADQQALIETMQNNDLPLKTAKNTAIIIPVPKPTPVTSASPQKHPSKIRLFQSSEHNVGKTLILAFKLMLHHRTNQAIDDFEARLADQHNLDTELMHTIKQDLETLRPNKVGAITPIPEATLKNILQNLARFGIQEENPTYTSPTPFSIKPKLDPFKST